MVPGLTAVMLRRTLVMARDEKLMLTADPSLLSVPTATVDPSEKTRVAAVI